MPTSLRARIRARAAAGGTAPRGTTRTAHPHPSRGAVQGAVRPGAPSTTPTRGPGPARYAAHVASAAADTAPVRASAPIQGKA